MIERGDSIMVHFTKLFAASTLAFALTACGANYHTVERHTPFGDDGKAIHLDAKQRVVLTKKGSGSFGEIVCAEPSPSGISAISGGFSFGAGVQGQGAASLANSLAESAVKNELQTQTTETLKQTLFRICEMYFNRGLDQRMVMSLHQRFQNSTVVIAAIEQLTGVTAANTAELGGSAKASATAEVMLQLENTLKTAEERESEREQSVKEARLAQEKANRQADADQQAADDAEAAGRPAEDVTALRDKARESRLAADQAQSDLERSEKARDRAKSDRETAEKLHQNAKTSADTEATATAKTSVNPAGGLKATDAVAVGHIANAVENIVLAHLKQDHVRDACISFMGDYADIKDANLTLELAPTIKWCQEYLKLNPPT